MSTQTQHTPGPWIWKHLEDWKDDYYEGEVPSLYSGDECVAYLGDCTQYYPTSGSPPNQADRRLIAAAPDMLEALQAVLNSDMAMMAEDEGRHEPVLEQAKAAVALATQGGVGGES